MARPYRVSFLRTIFVSAFLLGAALPVLMPSAALADDDQYTVTSVRVDVTAANGVDAKTQAFNQAETAAITQLAGRILAPGEAKNFLPPPPDTIATMVDDFEITNEQLSSTRYIGTYTFRFNHGMAKSYINSKAAMAPEPAPAAAATGAPVQTMGSTPDETASASAAASPMALPRSATAASTAMHNSLSARVHFASMREWMQAQRALRQTPGVASVGVQSLTPTQATVMLSYSGSENALRSALQQSGITLTGGAPADGGGQDWNQAYDPSAGPASVQPAGGGYDMVVTGGRASALPD